MEEAEASLGPRESPTADAPGTSSSHGAAATVESIETQVMDHDEESEAQDTVCQDQPSVLPASSGKAALPSKAHSLKSEEALEEDIGTDTGLVKEGETAEDLQLDSKPKDSPVKNADTGTSIGGGGVEDKEEAPNSNENIPREALTPIITNRNDLPVDDMAPRFVEVVFEDPGPLFLDLCNRPQGFGAVLKGFRATPGGGRGKAEREGKVGIGDLLMNVNGVDVTLKTFDEIIELVTASFVPKRLTFLSSDPTTRMDPVLAFGPTDDDLEAEPSVASVASILEASNINSSHLLKRFSKLKTGFNIMENVSKPQDIFQTMKPDMVNMLKKVGSKWPQLDFDENNLSNLISSITLEQDGQYHNDLITMRSGDTYISSKEVMKKLQVVWFRATPGGAFFEIPKVKGAFYHPNVDDMGAKVCVQVQSLEDRSIFKLVECGPLQPNPEVLERFKTIMESNVESRFCVTTHLNQTQLVLSMTTSGVKLLDMLDVRAETPLLSAEYHKFFRSWSDGVGDDSTNVGSTGRIQLCTSDDIERDVIVLALRSFRSRVIHDTDNNEALDEETSAYIAVDADPHAITPELPTSPNETAASDTSVQSPPKTESRAQGGYSRGRMPGFSFSTSSGSPQKFGGFTTLFRGPKGPGDGSVDKLSDMAGRITQAESAKQAAKTEIKILNKEINKQRHQLAETGRLLIHTQEALSGASMENEKALKTIANQQKKISALEKEIKHLKKEPKDIEASKAAKAQRLLELRDELQALKEEKRLAQRKLSSQRSLLSSLAVEERSRERSASITSISSASIAEAELELKKVYEEEVGSLRTKVSALQKQYDDLLEKHDNLEGLNDIKDVKLSKISSKCVELENESERLQAELAAAHAEARKASQMAVKIEKLEQAFVNADEERMKTEDKLREAFDAIKETEMNSERIQIALIECQTSLTEAVEDNLKLRRLQDQLNEEIEDQEEYLRAFRSAGLSPHEASQLLQKASRIQNNYARLLSEQERYIGERNHSGNLAKPLTLTISSPSSTISTRSNVSSASHIYRHRSPSTDLAADRIGSYGSPSLGSNSSIAGSPIRIHYSSTPPPSTSSSVGLRPSLNAAPFLNVSNKIEQGAKAVVKQLKYVEKAKRAKKRQEDLQILAEQLTVSLKDKEIALEHQRRANALLARRIQELEKQQQQQQPQPVPLGNSAE